MADILMAAGDVRMRRPNTGTVLYGVVRRECVAALQWWRSVVQVGGAAHHHQVP